MKRHCFFLLLMAAPFFASAQGSDPILMTVNGKNITKQEFLYSFNKNNTEETVEKKTVEEYLDLFKNFKLWIAEGEEQKVDTSRAFRQELAKYREESEKPYLTEIEADDSALKTEFKRMGEIVKISHILIAYPGFPRAGHIVAADTLELYKKASDILKKLAKGSKFADMVKEYSDDKTSVELGGFIGWYRGLNILFSLEQTAFSTPAGKYGLARSNWGYHILKIESREPFPGEFHAAHILISCAKDADTVQVADAEKNIRDLYEQAKNGVDFSELARDNSTDRGSAQNGGDLGWFEAHKMVQDFQDVVLTMKNNELSKPFRSEYGFHIIKMIDRKPYTANYEESKTAIEKALGNQGLYIYAHKSGIEKLKKELNFIKNDASYNNLIHTASTVYPTDSNYYAIFSDRADELFKVDGKTFTIADFIAYLKSNSRSPFSLSSEFLIDRLENYELSVIEKIRNENLEDEYPELKYLVQEYRDGIILFEVKNREVWEKASTDSAGLAQYFNANRTKYVWDSPRFNGYVVIAKDAKTKKEMQKAIKKMKPEDAVKYLIDNYKVGDVSYVKIEKGLFAKGDNTLVDEAVFKTGKAEYPENFSDFFLIGKKQTNPESADDIKGQVITDYQDYLEEQWTEKLNRKYTVTINREVLDSIK
jgi:peptidyl-prolyl cis-trans isomerase SurA